MFNFILSVFKGMSQDPNLVITNSVNNIYGVLNTALLVLGPVFVIWLNSRNSKKAADKVVGATEQKATEVKQELAIATAVADTKIEKIHNVVNGRFEAAQRNVDILAKQLLDAGIQPIIRTNTTDHVETSRP